jgi:hypothetical protein
MTAAWQEPAALLVVAATAALFLLRAFRRRRRAGMCGSDCACPAVRAGMQEGSAFPDTPLNVPAETRIFE